MSRLAEVQWLTVLPVLSITYSLLIDVESFEVRPKSSDSAALSGLHAQLTETDRRRAPQFSLNLNRRPASGGHDFFGTFSLNVPEKLSPPLPVALDSASFVSDRLVFGFSYVLYMPKACMRVVGAASSAPNRDLRWYAYCRIELW